MATTRGRTESWLEAHLATMEMANVLYGTIVGLALVLALQDDGYPSMEIVAFLIGTAIAISLAGVFSETISRQARQRAPLTRNDRQALWRETVAELAGCGFPAIFFVLAALGVMPESAAFGVSKWTGVALVCMYAFLAGRLAGQSRPHAARYAASAAVVGLGVIELKALVH